MIGIGNNREINNAVETFPYVRSIATLPWVSLIVALPLVSLLGSPAIADSAVLIDPNATSVPAKSPVKPKIVKASSANPVAVPTRKSAAVAAPVAAAEPGPLDLNITYTGELWQNNGGIKSGTDYMYGVDASLTVDAQKVFNIPDAKIYIEGFYVGGKSVDFGYTGAIEAPSALDAYDSMNLLKLYQLYYEQRFGGADILLGKYDVQTEFGTTRPMEVFGNKAQAINMAFLAEGQAANLNDPSVYPDTSVGVLLKQKFSDQWAVKLSLLDGLSDGPDQRAVTDVVFKDKYGALGISEVDFTPDKYTKLMAGVWGETGQLWELGQFTASYAPREKWGDMGEYVGGATRIYTIEGSRGVDVFFNAGVAPGDTNIISQSFDAGLTITGLIGARPNDKLGFAVGAVENSSGYKKLIALYGTQLPQYETSYELTYRAKITDWLTVQPEADYIDHPSGGAIKTSAFVYGLHFELHKDFN